MLWVLLLITALSLPFAENAEARSSRDDPYGDRYGGGGVRKLKPIVFEVEAFKFDAEAFKRTIVENNLFRPLGWTSPRPIEPYRLIGTILPRSENTPRKAIIQSTAGNTTYIVFSGERLDADTEVVSIESKQVVLSTKGQRRTLKLPSGF
ncbi:MAG: hypothetical protein OXU27_05615 [Candidatus Poribacteria bacterium]|nr:hypothetical protein [Candidatus Poribacteria bacterium]